jgi:hypothetical protein
MTRGPIKYRHVSCNLFFILKKLKKKLGVAMEPRGWLKPPPTPLMGVVSATSIKIKNKLHDTWRDLIGPHVIFVKSTNGQRMKRPIWSLSKP